MNRNNSNSSENISIDLGSLQRNGSYTSGRNGFISDSTQTFNISDNPEEVEERRLSKQFKHCFSVCCGGCCKCLGKCSLALVISSNVVISLALFITLLFIYASIRSIANNIQGQFDGNMYGEKCFEGLGCFPKLYGCLVPTVTIPQSPEQLGVKFHLFTNTSYEIFEDYDDIHIEMSEFNPRLDTKVIVHGFKNGYFEKNWMGKLKNLILENGDGMYNVIAVDWSKGANNNKYWKAAASTSVVGAIVAKFIQKLIDIRKADITRFHLIGHSLGAHITGAVGFHFPYPKIGLITGLDPAGPCFFKFISVNRDPKDFLDLEDATIVQTIHTNGKDLGYITPKPLSHYEFYPNGGEAQPDLKTAIESDTAFGSQLSCSHTFAHELVIYDYKQHNDCQPIAYNCPDWESYNNGKCSYNCSDKKCQIMALGIQYTNSDFPLIDPPMPMKLFVKTTGSQPYCIYRYIVYVRIHSSDGEEGVMNVNIRGKSEHFVSFDDRFYSNQDYKKELAFSPSTGSLRALGVIKEVEINFKAINTKNNIQIKEVFVKFLSSTLMTFDYICKNNNNFKLSEQNTTYPCHTIQI